MVACVDFSLKATWSVGVRLNCFRTARRSSIRRELSVVVEEDESEFTIGHDASINKNECQDDIEDP